MQIEETAATKLRRVGEGLINAAKNGRRSIDADTAAWTRRARSVLMRLTPADNDGPGSSRYRRRQLVGR